MLYGPKKYELHETFSITDGEFITTMSWRRNGKEVNKEILSVRRKIKWKNS